MKCSEAFLYFCPEAPAFKAKTASLRGIFLGDISIYMGLLMFSHSCVLWICDNLREEDTHIHTGPASKEILGKNEKHIYQERYYDK